MAFDRTPQEWVYNVLPYYLMEGLHKYFRVQIEGTDNLLSQGRAIIAPNHSGFSGFDAMVLTHEIRRLTGTRPKILTHYFWFLSQLTARPAQQLGFIEASMGNAIKVLNQGEKIVVFPEGERGNFKPTARSYFLQEFKRGFVRMAIKTQTPIVPTVIIGAEETHINLKRLRLPRYLNNLRVPLPLNLFPLPAKWKIVFMPPVELPYTKEQIDNRDLMRDLAFDLKERMQNQINEELARRESIFF